MKRVERKGFTLVELSFSLVFLGILSITIALLINDTVISYRRGITLNQLNTTGMDLVDDMRAAIQNSSAKAVVSICNSVYKDSGAVKRCREDGARKFVMTVRTGVVKRKRDKSQVGKDLPIYGSFCTGSYSYIWNSGYVLNDDYEVDVNDSLKKAILKYKQVDEVKWKPEEGKPPFRLLKVRDETRSVCISYTLRTNSYGYDSNNNSNSNPKKVDDGIPYNLVDKIESSRYAGEYAFGSISKDDEPIDILSSSGNMAVYDLIAAAPATNPAANTLFYSASLVLGTIQGGINVRASGNYCLTPTDYQNENFDYCAINKFNFAVRASGAAGE